jgi:ParB family transcriptional regulator, chromosome partitioning protein
MEGEMAKNSRDAYGATGESKVLHFKPEDLKLVKDETHVLYDERVAQEISDEFVSNIDFMGIVEPVVVRKNTETGAMEVVAGRQRVRAAIEANKRRKKRGDKLLLVPATVRRGDDMSMMTVMVTENEARVANTPLQRAQLMQRMLNRGATEKDVATSMACSIATVKNHLGLMEAPAAVRNAVQSGKVSAAVGYKLSKMPAAEAKAKLAEATTSAPKERGKRTGAAKKQMEVVTGVKSSTLPKSRVDVEAMRDIIEENADLGGEIKRLMVAVCDWMLGDEDDLREICGMESKMDNEFEEEDEEDKAGE